MMLVKHFRRRTSNRRPGAALVEFALVFPVIMLFFTSMIGISRILMLQHTADSAAYEAARAAMIPGATSADARQEAEILLDIAELQGTSVTVSPEKIDEDTAIIMVVVDVPVALNSWFLSDVFKNFTVRSEVTLLTERSPIVRLTGLPALKAKKAKLKAKALEL